jgi:tetratricopeptide (TPR) repeat protein
MESRTVFSCNRHTRSVARSVSLLVASTLLIASGAQATETVRPKLVLTAYTNGAGGDDLVKGNYSQALNEIQHYRPQMMIAASAKTTNLCVAYTALKQLDQAKVACDVALRQAKYDKVSASRFSLNTMYENAYVAIAYTNRAVVHMLSRDEASAKADLEKAKALAPHADFVARNEAVVAAWDARSTIAQVEVSPSR